MKKKPSKYEIARRWLNFMSTAYFVLGLCQAVTGFVAWRLYNREEEEKQ